MFLVNVYLTLDMQDHEGSLIYILLEIFTATKYKPV